MTGLVLAYDTQVLRRDALDACDVLRRRLYNAPVTGCAWCGYVCRTPTGDRPFFYQYGRRYESGREVWNPRLFCQQSCKDKWEKA